LGDARGIRQVLVNLLSNAIKYTPSGFVRLSVSKRSVSDQVVELVFTVEDSGIGISEEDQSRLFDDFVQLSHDKFDHYVEGTGLGLVISRSLCRLMGGDISVESVLGRGSAFTATVRQVVVDPSPLDPEDGKLSDILAPKSPASFTAPGCRVLVVDDIATNLTVASGLLAPYQMDVATCLSGEEAVRLEERERFDLIFIDQMMPGLDGVETLKALRALGEDRAATPMVALTANAMAGVKEALLAQGFDDYLSKPIDSGELDFILDKWVQPVARLAAPDGGPGGQEAANMPFFAPVLARGGIDARTGLSRCGGSVEVFEKILKAFLRDVERLAPSLASADAAEAPAIVISVHAIKSASANIGALTLSAEAAAIEANLKAGLTDDIDSGRLAALRRSLLDMAGAVREALAAAEAARGDGGGDGAGAGELGRLKEALLAGDVGLSDKLVDTLSRKGDGPTRSVLERVSYHVLVSDYQEAARLVGDLMAGAAAEEARD
jgi:CheY-like chemotaxis protein